MYRRKEKLYHHETEIFSFHFKKKKKEGKIPSESFSILSVEYGTHTLNVHVETIIMLNEIHLNCDMYIKLKLSVTEYNQLFNLM